MHVAVIDNCEFTMIGLQYLCRHKDNEQQDIIFHGFRNIDDFLVSEWSCDIVIYDPLNTENFMITPNEDILRIKKIQPDTRIYIYSLSSDFLKFKHVDGVITKRVSLNDIKAMWQILISQTPKALNQYKMSITTHQNPARLSHEEASVLRGYSYNLKTKQIARQLDCNVKLVYFYKNNAIDKLNAVRGLSFYQSIRWILN